MADTVPVLAEHQAQDLNASNPVEYTPSTEERKTLKLVDSIFQKHKKHRKAFDENWHEYYKYFRGKQWSDQRPSYRHSEVVNFIFQTIQSQVPQLADARQRIEFSAREPGDTEFAKILDQCCESDWDDGNWTFKLAEMLYDGHIFGTGLGGLEFDPEARFGAGSLVMESLDPFHCFPDPNARDVNVKSRAMVIAKPEDIAILKRENPEKAKFIKPDLLDFAMGKKEGMEQFRYKSPTDNRVGIEGSSFDELGHSDQALKITVYLFDDDFDEEKTSETDPLSGQVTDTYTQKLKYPNGRKICVAGGVVLSDGPMPLEDKLIPYFRYVNYIDPRVFWGISEVEQLKGPQNIFNKIYSFVLDVLTLMGNPIWVVDDTSGVDTDNLFNSPGLVIEKAPNTTVDRMEGTQLQPYVLQILDRVREYVDSIAGSNDVSRGVQPGGITAASAITSLQEAANTRARQKSRNLDATLQSFGQLYKAYALQVYSAPRVFRVTGDQAAARYFKFHIESRPDPETGDEQKVGIVRNYVPDPETGEMKEELSTKEFLIRGDFDVKVTTGSSLPFAKDQKFAKARQLFQDGVIDQEEYLKQAEYPNYEVVLTRMREAAAQAAALQAQPPGPGGPSLPPAPSAPGPM